MATQEWLNCQPGKHQHIWHDPSLRVDFPIPETFMTKIRNEIDTPLEEAVGVIKAALDSLEPYSVAWIILNGYLHPEPEEVTP